MKLKLTVLSASIVALLLPAASVWAQSTSGSATSNDNNSNSMRISPVRTDIATDPGTVKEVTVYGQNMSARAVQVRVIVSDFAASTDETGKPNVILEENAYAPSHSLRRLASVEPSTVTLEPGVRSAVKVKITVPKNAKAGGYYGAVRFVPANNVTTGDSTGVSIATNVGSLILLRVNGDLIEKLKLETMDVRQKDKAGTFFNTPDDLKVRVRLKNIGNVQVQPFGKVQLLDRSGKIIEEHEINNTDPRGNVLPDTIRRFEVDLKKVSNFGKYTVQGNFSNTNGELITYKTSFWVVPTTYIIAAVGALLIIGLIVFLTIKVMRLSGGRRTYGRRY